MHLRSSYTISLRLLCLPSAHCVRGFFTRILCRFIFISLSNLTNSPWSHLHRCTVDSVYHIVIYVKWSLENATFRGSPLSMKKQTFRVVAVTCFAVRCYLLLICLATVSRGVSLHSRHWTVTWRPDLNGNAIQNNTSHAFLFSAWSA
jgi:hypothetical protein